MPQSFSPEFVFFFSVLRSTSFEGGDRSSLSMSMMCENRLAALRVSGAKHSILYFTAASNVCTHRVLFTSITGKEASGCRIRADP